MREGLKKFPKNAYGLTALKVLHHYMDPPSSDQLHHLLHEYPDHVIEFTCCEGAVGELGYNTIFWEVRGY